MCGWSRRLCVSPAPASPTETQMLIPHGKDSRATRATRCTQYGPSEVAGGTSGQGYPPDCYIHPSARTLETSPIPVGVYPTIIPHDLRAMKIGERYLHLHVRRTPCATRFGWNLQNVERLVRGMTVALLAAAIPSQRQAGTCRHGSVDKLCFLPFWS